MNAALAMSHGEDFSRAGPAEYVETQDEGQARPQEPSTRDRRGINRMAPELRATHQDLLSWAKLVSWGIGVGWQSKSLLGRLIEQGPNGLSQGSAPVTSISDDDVATDAAVAYLGDVDRRVVWAYYVDWHKARDGQWWRLAGMGEKQAANVLNRARWRVNGYRAGWYRRNI